MDSVFEDGSSWANTLTPMCKIKHPAHSVSRSSLVGVLDSPKLLDAIDTILPRAIAWALRQNGVDPTELDEGSCPFAFHELAEFNVSETWLEELDDETSRNSVRGAAIVPACENDEGGDLSREGNLPYGGDINEAMRAGDRNAIREIMNARSASTVVEARSPTPTSSPPASPPVIDVPTIEDIDDIDALLEEVNGPFDPVAKVCEKNVAHFCVHACDRFPSPSTFIL